MATATQIRTDEIGLWQQINVRRELMRRGEITQDNGQGGWITLGKLVELRYERSAEHAPIPAHLRTYFARCGNVIDWAKSIRKPLIGTDRARSIALIVSNMPEIPEIDDPAFTPQEFIELDGNVIPLASVPASYLPRLKERGVKNVNQKLSKPEKIKVRFSDHACGSMGEFLVIRPITEAWVQLAGVPAIQKLVFTPRGNEFPGLYLDPDSGEAHFLGGNCDFERRVGA
jgi:hypothetical protein